jgi:hypothetical protein
LPFFGGSPGRETSCCPNRHIIIYSQLGGILKKITITITLFLILTALNAQNWPPLGAKWTYSHHSWFYPYPNEPKYIECIGDTIIDGKTCRILEDNCLCGFNEGWASFIYRENDKVYIYTDSIKGFNLLYDFGAGPGDSWTLISPNPEFGDSTVVTVLALGTEVILGDTFNVQYIDNDPYSCYYLESYIIENIGSHYCFYPINICLDPITGPIRCYEDTNGLIKFTDLPCDTVIINSIEENSAYNLIKIFPNPAHSRIFVNVDSLNNDEYSVSILSVNGQKQIHTTSLKNNAEIIIEKLRRGVYYIQLEFENGQTVIKKIIKE